MRKFANACLVVAVLATVISGAIFVTFGDPPGIGYRTFGDPPGIGRTFGDPPGIG